MRFLRLSALFFLGVFLFVSCTEKEGVEEEEESGYCMQYKNLEMASKYAEGGKVSYNVLTPVGFDPNGKEKYCVIYLLHGAGDDHSAWLSSPQERGGQTSLASQMLSAYKAGAVPKTVVVMPDAKLFFYMGGFEDFFYKEFIPEIEKTFAIDSRRECRAVAGLSMGGFGAAYYGLKYPEMYCYVYTMSQAAGEPLYSLAAEADKSKLPYFHIVNGTSDATVGSQPKFFYEYIRSLDVQCSYEEWFGGHDWKFWGECIPKFLSLIGAEFKK